MYARSSIIQINASDTEKKKKQKPGEFIAICVQACGVRFQNVRFTFQNVRLPFQNARLPFQNVLFFHVTCHVWAMKLTCFRG